MTQITCSTCRFYNTAYGGRCHRYPPTDPTPTIPKDWWCGEHSAAAATAERDFPPPDLNLTLTDPHLEAAP